MKPMQRFRNWRNERKTGNSRLEQPRITAGHRQSDPETDHRTTSVTTHTWPSGEERVRPITMVSTDSPADYEPMLVGKGRPTPRRRDIARKHHRGANVAAARKMAKRNKMCARGRKKGKRLSANR